MPPLPELAPEYHVAGHRSGPILVKKMITSRVRYLCRPTLELEELLRGWPAELRAAFVGPHHCEVDPVWTYADDVGVLVLLELRLRHSTHALVRQFFEHHPVSVDAFQRFWTLQALTPELELPTPALHGDALRPPSLSLENRVGSDLRETDAPTRWFSRIPTEVLVLGSRNLEHREDLLRNLVSTFGGSTDDIDVESPSLRGSFRRYASPSVPATRLWVPKDGRPKSALGFATRAPAVADVVVVALERAPQDVDFCLDVLESLADSHAKVLVSVPKQGTADPLQARLRGSEFQTVQLSTGEPASVRAFWAKLTSTVARRRAG